MFGSHNLYSDLQVARLGCSVKCLFPALQLQGTEGQCLHETLVAKPC